MDANPLMPRVVPAPGAETLPAPDAQFPTKELHRTGVRALPEMPVPPADERN